MFTGRQFDEETALYYYRARYYDPGKGRFLMRDPLEYNDSMNLYAYVGDRPTLSVDPNGYTKVATRFVVGRKASGGMAAQFYDLVRVGRRALSLEFDCTESDGGAKLISGPSEEFKDEKFFGKIEGSQRVVETGKKGGCPGGLAGFSVVLMFSNTETRDLKTAANFSAQTAARGGALFSWPGFLGGAVAGFGIGLAVQETWKATATVEYQVCCLCANGKKGITLLKPGQDFKKGVEFGSTITTASDVIVGLSQDEPVLGSSRYRRIQTKNIDPHSFSTLYSLDKPLRLDDKNKAKLGLGLGGELLEDTQP
jgi:RHS repeat-associated protein